MPETIWDAIERAIKNVFRKGDLIERVEKEELRPYNTITIDLGTARTNNEFTFKGDKLSVLNLTGSATLRFNEKNNDPFDLEVTKRFEMPFYRFFITNTAQTGKTLELFIGREGSASAAKDAIMTQDELTDPDDVIYGPYQYSIGAGSTTKVLPFSAGAAAKDYVYEITKAWVQFDADTGNAGTYVIQGTKAVGGDTDDYYIEEDASKVSGTMPNLKFDGKAYAVQAAAIADIKGFFLKASNAGAAAKNATFCFHRKRVK